MRLFGGAVPWLAHAEEQYYGSRVATLALSGAESESDLQTVSLTVGEVITPENVRASIQALYNTGKYSYIEVDATPAGSGTIGIAVVTFGATLDRTAADLQHFLTDLGHPVRALGQLGQDDDSQVQ